MTDKRKAMYKKPKAGRQALFATLRIVLTAALVAVLGIIIFYVAKDGWESVLHWFVSKYACMILVILLFAATAAMWLWKLVKTMQRLKEDD